MKIFFTHLVAIIITIVMYFTVGMIGSVVFGPLFGMLSEYQVDQVAYLKAMSGAMLMLWLYQYGLTKLFTYFIRLSVDKQMRK